MSLGDTKSTRAANWQDSGDRSSLIRISGSHGPGVPETREANVKCTDKTESKLDVRGHRHIRRQHILKATCFCNWVSKVA
ncbi:hypothetical protein Prudu_012969 [Prunus dulcis]|uniref:Uncharacterized protein n=1 Tax=Prunus dulcis TaxID=3755 RepID=A0A4Y1RDW9_PRUDU|nr:hypothetical protein Prudu_012969 [Prunus dulcis]